MPGRFQASSREAGAARVFGATLGHEIPPAAADRFLDHYFAPGDLAGKAVLDAGCRVGDYCLAFLRRGAGRVVGIDLSIDCIEAAQTRHGSRPGLEFVHADVLDLGCFADSEFAVAMASTTLSYLDPARVGDALRELLRVVEPGGVLLLLFLRDQGPLYRLATAVADLLPARAYGLVVGLLSRMPAPLAARLAGRPVDRETIRYLLWGLQGLHYGVPAAIPERFRVETATTDDASPKTSASYRIPVPEDKAALLAEIFRDREGAAVGRPALL